MGIIGCDNDHFFQQNFTMNPPVYVRKWSKNLELKLPNLDDLVHNVLKGLNVMEEQHPLENSENTNWKNSWAANEGLVEYLNFHRGTISSSWKIILGLSSIFPKEL